jgi:RNA polymerase sigma factor (sigma-70 family)
VGFFLFCASKSSLGFDPILSENEGEDHAIAQGPPPLVATMSEGGEHPVKPAGASPALQFLSDGELLAEYRSRRAPEVFSQMVQRHQGMVFHTCKRILADEHDAEDATQAVFLILAQRPGLVRTVLAGWLHNVARGTAIDILRARISRTRREENAMRLRSAASITDQNQLREEIDAALERLPDRLREAVVLRYLEGQDQETAARQSGCPRGTLARRAAEGLERLRAVLVRRGAVVTPAVLAAFMTQEAAASVPKLCLAISLEGGRAALLAQSTMKAMFWAKVKLWATVVAVAATVGTATPLIVGRSSSPTWGPLTVERTTLKGHTSEVRFVAYAPNGQTLATTSYDGTLRLWNTATNQELAVVRGHTGRVHCVAFSPDGKRLATTCDDGTIRFFDPSGKLLDSLQAGLTPMFVVAFSPGGQSLITTATDNTIKVWDTATLREVATLDGASGHVVPDAVIAPNSRLLVSGGYDNLVTFWDLTAQRKRSTGKHDGAVHGLAFSPDGKLLASGSWDKTVKLWDPVTGKEVAELRGHSDRVAPVAFSRDGKVLASGSWDKTVKLWDVATRQELATLQGHTGPIWTLAFSPDGKTLATGSVDGTVKLWSSSADQKAARRQ